MNPFSHAFPADSTTESHTVRQAEHSVLFLYGNCMPPVICQCGSIMPERTANHRSGNKAVLLLKPKYPQSWPLHLGIGFHFFSKGWVLPPIHTFPVPSAFVSIWELDSRPTQTRSEPVSPPEQTRWTSNQQEALMAQEQRALPYYPSSTESVFPTSLDPGSYFVFQSFISSWCNLALHFRIIFY